MLLVRQTPLRALLAALSLLILGSVAAVAQSGDASVRQALATTVRGDATLNAFYTARNYEPIWLGKNGQNKRRQKEFLATLSKAGNHGLPLNRYDVAGLSAALKSARSAQDHASVEAAMSKAFVQYARDVQSGVLTPGRVDSGIHRGAPRRDPVKNLVAFSKSSPSGFLKALPPKTTQYAGLMEEKLRLEKAIGAGGWGPKVQASSLKLGQSGNQVAVLRNRLAAMGYKSRGGASFDTGLQTAVASFQRDHGLNPDGVVGKGTIAEINRDPSDRLQQVIVAMERERWTNLPLGRRHVWVNIPDFTARIVDNGKTTFESRSVVGKNASTHRTPEFSDVMEFMVINPTWNVPRSITTKEYLPMLQENPNAVSHLQLIDSQGNSVSRGSVNFASYTAGDFPYRLKEPPRQGNALGQVKFMFPNRHNIYLHDTPQKALFARESRAYSHGCVRLGDPTGFAHALLAKQTGNPKGAFSERLNSGRENTLALKEPIRVHIVYRTAFIDGKDDVQYRRDVYGRDAKVFQALSNAGVSLRAARG